MCQDPRRRDRRRAVQVALGHEFDHVESHEFGLCHNRLDQVERVADYLVSLE